MAMKRNVSAAVAVFLSAASSLVATARAQNTSALVGINVVHPQNLTVDQQNEILKNLKAAGVKIIRTGIAPDDKSLDFIKRVYAEGIRVEWITAPQFRPDAP